LARISQWDQLCNAALQSVRKWPRLSNLRSEEHSMSGTTSVLTLDIDRNANPIVVRCHGKLVAGVGDTLYSQVKPLLPGSKRIILDLTDLVRMDSMGLGTLARLYVSARREGCSLQLINLGKQVRLLLDTTHMLETFTSLANTALR
jgi:anti-sigma B factor antagonist